MKIRIAVTLFLLFASCTRRDSEAVAEADKTVPSDTAPEVVSDAPAPMEIFFPSVDSLDAFVAGNAMLDGGVTEALSASEAILGSYELYPSEALLEGKSGVLPRVVIELFDKDGREEPDSLILNAWYETKNGGAVPEINDFNALSDTFSYLTYRADTGNFNPVLQQIIYAPRGIQKELFSHLLYSFFRKTEDFGVFLENNGYEIEGPYILSENAAFFGAAEPDLPIIAAKDFQSVFNDVFGTSLTVGEDEDEIFRFGNTGEDFFLYLEKDLLTGALSPLTIEFGKMRKEGIYDSVAETWNHLQQGCKIIQAVNPPGQKEVLQLKLQVPPYLTPDALRLLLKEAKEELREIELLAGYTTSTSKEPVIHPDLEEAASIFAGTYLDAAVLEMSLPEGNKTVLLVQPQESLMKENPPIMYVWPCDSIYDEDADPDSLILMGSYPSASSHALPSFTEKDAVWASYWNEKRAARISRGIRYPGAWLSMRIHMPDGLDKKTFREYITLFFDEYVPFSQDIPQGVVSFPINPNDLMPPRPSESENHSADAISGYLESAFGGTFAYETYFDEGYQYTCPTHPELRVYSSADNQGRQQWLEVHADFDGKQIDYETMDEWNRGSVEKHPVSIMSQHPQSGEQPSLKTYVSLNARPETILPVLEEFNREVQTVRREY